MVGFFARAQERATKLVQDKYTYKRKAEDSVARVEVLEMELAAERNESKKLKDNCAKLEKSFEEAVDALEGLVAVAKGL
jgi:predicted nuclease with TOPRIM domain